MNINKLNKTIEDVTVNVNVSANRIAALDIIRGFFLAAILIDHIELYPSGFDLFTGRGVLYASAAEGFFFMSGLLVGMVYKRRMQFGNWFIAKRMWRRAIELYLASVFFTLFFTALAVLTNHETIKYGLYSVINWPHIIKETLLMRYGFGWTDFLDRFAILMFIAPVVFYLLAKGRWKLMLAASFTIWLFRTTFSPYDFTTSWQFLFNGSMLLGFYWQDITNKWRSLSTKLRRQTIVFVTSFSAVTFVISYASVFLLSLLNEKLIGLPHWLSSLTLHWNNFNAWIWLYAQKWTLGPFRLILFMFWFATLFMIVQRYHGVINRRTKHLIELLGRNSLLVYIEHAFIVFIFKYFIPPQTVFWQNFLITGSSLACLVILTIFYKTYEPGINAGVSKVISALRKPFSGSASTAEA